MSQAQKKDQAQQAPKKKGRSNRPRYLMYDISASSAKMKNKKCPRCGAVMAFHTRPRERWVCGSCSFTDFPGRAQ